MAEGMTDPPPVRGLDVLTTLVDFAIVHWEIDARKLDKHLPPGFKATEFPMADGGSRPVIGAVVFRDTGFRFAALPFLRFSMGQTNYRSYVQHDGEEVAWFFGTSLTGPSVVMPRLLWKLPWEPARMKFRCTWDGDRLQRYDVTTRSRWAPFRIVAHGTGRRMPAVGLPGDEARHARVLTHPTKGFFRRRDGRVGTYSIWRGPLDLELAEVETCSFGLYERLGLIAPGQAPLHVLVQRAVDFRIYLPPRLAS